MFGPLARTPGKLEDGLPAWFIGSCLMLYGSCFTLGAFIGLDWSTPAHLLSCTAHLGTAKSWHGCKVQRSNGMSTATTSWKQAGTAHLYGIPLPRLPTVQAATPYPSKLERLTLYHDHSHPAYPVLRHMIAEISFTGLHSPPPAQERRPTFPSLGGV